MFLFLLCRKRVAPRIVHRSKKSSVVFVFKCAMPAMSDTLTEVFNMLENASFESTYRGLEGEELQFIII